MCSAGQLNGTRICEDTALLTDTLRGAWGFAGAVLAEPGAVQDPARTLAAGVDFAPADAGRLVDAVQSGALDESVLNRAASNIIRTLLAASTQPSPADRDRTADRSLAVELAKQSGVLLRNLGALPLHKGQKVAYIGAFADHPRYSVGHPRAPQVTSAIDAAVLHGRKIHYIEGFPRGPRPARRGGVPACRGRRRSCGRRGHLCRSARMRRAWPPRTGGTCACPNARTT